MMLTRIHPFVLVLLASCNSFAFGAADRASVLHSGSLVQSCPLGVPWTLVEKIDTVEGVAVDFSTTLPANVTELRHRVRDQALAYGPNTHRGIGHEGEHGGPRDHGLRLWTMGTTVQADVLDTSAGARIFVTPTDPARRAELRERVGQRVAQLKAADCPQ